jgi:hypothetical protein
MVIHILIQFAGAVVWCSQIEGTYPTIEKKMRERELRAAMEAAANGHTPVISTYGQQTPRSGKLQRPNTAPSNAARKVDVTFSADQQGGRGAGPRPSSRQGYHGALPPRPQTSCGMAAPDQLQSLAGLASRQAEALNGSSVAGSAVRSSGVRPASAAPAVGGTYGAGG